jgi:predicted nucleic acid-binding protein
LKIDGFVADTSSLILLNKAKLINTFSFAFNIIITQSVKNELTVKNNNFPLNNLKVFPQNNKADQDIVTLWRKAKTKALLCDDLKILENAIKTDKPYLSAIVVPYILKYHQLLTPEKFLNSVNYLEKNGFYSKNIINKAKSFSTNLPLWMKRLTTAIQN